MEDRLVSFSDSDQGMHFALKEARRTLRMFLDAFVAPKPNQQSFLLKVRFESDGVIEHIWVADIDASVFPMEATIANEPNLPGLKFMGRTSFDPSQITDWMYIEDGYLVGGFTTQVIRAAMSPAERAEHDLHAPYKFKD
jgi:uncharacterized protein YegJ (DUF2314 family)